MRERQCVCERGREGERLCVREKRREAGVGARGRGQGGRWLGSGVRGLGFGFLPHGSRPALRLQETFWASNTFGGGSFL